MVQLLVSAPPIDPSVSAESDYNENPTALFKFIEAKDWYSVKSRIEENVEEVASWITRRGKDGKMRWKILPLHALISLKAPTDVVTTIINAYPQACSLADDEGRLPLHLAMNNEDIDEEVLKLLLQINPSGVNTKDKEGKLPLGRPVLMAVDMLQEMEREKIRSEERYQFDTILDEEREAKSKEIEQLKEEITRLKEYSSTYNHQELEVRLTTEQDIKYKQMEEDNEKQQEKIKLQSNELALKEEQLRSALIKLTSQEEYIMKYRKMNQGQSCELGNALSNINDLNSKIFLLQAQLDTQAGELKHKKEQCETSLANEKALLDEIEKIKETCDIGDLQVEGLVKTKGNEFLSLEKLTKSVNEFIARFKDQIEKVKSSKSIDAHGSTEEEKDEELLAVKSRYSAFLEKITKLLNDIIAQINDQIKNIKDKSHKMHKSLVEKKDDVTTRFRDLFEKMINGTVDHFKHICKDRGEKKHALLTSETEECEESNKSVEEVVLEEASKCVDEETIEERNKIDDDVVGVHNDEEVAEKESNKIVDDVVGVNDDEEEVAVKENNTGSDLVECEENKDVEKKVDGEGNKCDEEGKDVVLEDIKGIGKEHEVYGKCNDSCEESP